MKKANKLNETKLRQIISETVKKVIKEGHFDSNVYDEFSEIREMIGDDTLISELYNWMGADSIEGFIKHIKRYYEI